MQHLQVYPQIGILVSFFLPLCLAPLEVHEDPIAAWTRAVLWLEEPFVDCVRSEHDFSPVVNNVGGEELCIGHEDSVEGWTLQDTQAALQASLHGDSLKPQSAICARKQLGSVRSNLVQVYQEGKRNVENETKQFERLDYNKECLPFAVLTFILILRTSYNGNLSPAIMGGDDCFNCNPAMIIWVQL